MADFLPLAERALEQLRLQRPGRGQVSKVLPRLEGGWQDKLLLASEYSSPEFTVIWKGARIGVRCWPAAWPNNLIWRSRVE